VNDIIDGIRDVKTDNFISKEDMTDFNTDINTDINGNK
jgi:hypothetical protein